MIEMSSERCEITLKSPPPCDDFRRVRSYVMCAAWRAVDEKKIPFRQAIKEGWSAVRKVCVT